MLDRRRWNRRDEFHEISVPFGLAPAEQECTNSLSCVLYVLCGAIYTGIYVPSSVRPLRVDSNMIKVRKILKAESLIFT